MSKLISSHIPSSPALNILILSSLLSQVTELVSKLDEGEAVFQLQIKFIKEVDFLDSEYLQLMNILMRRCMEHLGLQHIGRSSYNPNAEIRDERHKLVSFAVKL